MAARNKPNELYITRVYDAPVKMVWEAWTDPAHVAKWWGPRGFTLTTHSKDLRAGGHWNYTMHGPDGTDFPNITTYHEVEKYRRLVYDHGANETQPPLFRVTVDFTDIKGKTKMEMTMALATAEAAKEIKKFIKHAGGDSTWDRLAEYLEKVATEKEKFVINRAFDAPLEKIFAMWTDLEHLSRWLPPTGMRMEVVRGKIHAGDGLFYFMTNDKDVKMWGRVDYDEIARLERVTYRQQFCDEKGAISRHPFMPTWPETMRTTVLFAGEDSGRTRVTVTWEPYGEVTPAELAKFIEFRGSMTQGWTGSFDKLEALL